MNDIFSMEFNPTQGEELWVAARKNTHYREFVPCRALQPYVVCYWVSKTDSFNNQAIESRIIPDGCMDIVFNMTEIEKGKGGLICGLMTSPEVMIVKEVREFIGIRFWPAGIIPFLGYSAADFRDQLIPMEDILGKNALDISEKIGNVKRIEEQIMLIEEWLKNLLPHVQEINPFIKNVLLAIYRDKGIISVKKLSEELNISQRHLSRKFNEWVGANAKTFSNIIRFQNTIHQLNQRNHIDYLEIALNNGYYDQAHFIKEFKYLYGKTPSQFK